MRPRAIESSSFLKNLQIFPSRLPGGVIYKYVNETIDNYLQGALLIWNTLKFEIFFL